MPTPARYPGIASTADGSSAIVHVETAISEAATAYPITPTTNMGAGYQEKVANGAQNLWGASLGFIELESEHSAAAACEGFAMAGGRVANFTSGQGLILMKEVLYTIAGKHLGLVFNIGARALTSQALNVHCGHDDIFGVLDTGWGCLFARTVQEAADLCLIARRTAEDCQVPFFNVQDGFLTTHTVESLLLPEAGLMKDYVGEPGTRLPDLFDPAKALMVGVVQNQDAYMKGKVGQRLFYERVQTVLERNFEEFEALTGRHYGLVDSYRMEGASMAVVGLGSAMETMRVAVDHMRDVLGWKVGLVHPTCLRPFPAQALVAALRGVQAVTVIERVDEPLAQDNPLTRELKAALSDAPGTRGAMRLALPRVYSGVYGLGSRDFRVEDAVAVVRNMRRDGGHKASFSCGIPGDWALPPEEAVDGRGKNSFSMRGHSVGGYGSVTTNKIIATLSAELFGLQVQAFPKYGSEKKGLPTTYFLTISQEPIRIHCELSHVDFVAVNDTYAFFTGNPLAGLGDGGVLFLQSPHLDPAKVLAEIPPKARELIATKGLKVLYMDMVKAAKELAPSADLQQRMQGILLLGVFLRVAPYAERLGLSEASMEAKLRAVLAKYFGKRGDAVVEANLEAVRRGMRGALEVPAELLKPSKTPSGRA
jgi:pyruvate-ferredoxin/flavodoxin oxidoreductase